MALFKPNGATTTGTSFKGICECNIINIEDKSDLFDWSDIYLQVTLLQNGSKYTRNANIVGGFEKDANGKITGGSVLKRMYAFFNTIGCKAGVNINGGWEEDNGDAIDNIATYLNKRFTVEWDGLHRKKPGKNPYNVAHYKLYTNTEDNKTKLQGDIDWMKSKGYLKEATETPVVEIDIDDLKPSVLDNL